MNKKPQTRKIFVGKIAIGGGASVSVQSMTNTDTRDAKATLKQIIKLHRLGCEIIRVAVPDIKAVATLTEITANSPMPVIADIHFDYKLALGAIKAGAHGIRINPGNIGDKKNVAKIAEAAGEAGIPIRVGANSGSLSAKFKRHFRNGKRPNISELADALVQSALEQCGMLEKFGFSQIKVSLKASDVPSTIAAYKKISELSDYPLHLGITEAGTFERGIVKSSVGIGTLLIEGLGDTIRVSLTGDPALEVKVAIMILEAAGLRKAAPEIVSCPTCGRTEIPLEKLVTQIEKIVEKIKKHKLMPEAKIAVMGCAVNGPGEARDADIGISGAKNGKLVIFKKGNPLGAYDYDKGLKVFTREIEEL